jgi:hypothetical protein
MKTYKFKLPFQGNRKGDTVTEDRHGQLLVKAGSNNIMWGPKDVFRAESMGMIEDVTIGAHSLPNEPMFLPYGAEHPIDMVFKSIEQTRLEKMMNDLAERTYMLDTTVPRGISNSFKSALIMPDTCQHPSPRRENDELFCEICKKRWEAKDEI